MANVSMSTTGGGAGLYGVTCNLTGAGVATGPTDWVTPIDGARITGLLITYAEAGSMTDLQFRIEGRSAVDSTPYILSFGTAAGPPNVITTALFSVTALAATSSGYWVPLYAAGTAGTLIAGLDTGGLDAIRINITAIGGTAAAGDALKVTFIGRRGGQS